MDKLWITFKIIGEVVFVAPFLPVLFPPMDGAQATDRGGGGKTGKKGEAPQRGAS